MTPTPPWAYLSYDRSPVTRGHSVAEYSLLHGPWAYPILELNTPEVWCGVKTCNELDSGTLGQ